MTTVLIVDDDRDIRELIEFKLLQLGLEVITAVDGQEGLDTALALRPTLVLLDVMMPRMSGIQVCAELRQHPETAGCTIIMLTAKAQDSDVEAGFAAGADDYIVKPFSPRDLASRIERHLEERRRLAS